MNPAERLRALLEKTLTPVDSVVVMITTIWS